VRCYIFFQWYINDISMIYQWYISVWGKQANNHTTIQQVVSSSYSTDVLAKAMFCRFAHSNCALGEYFVRWVSFPISFQNCTSDASHEETGSLSFRSRHLHVDQFRTWALLKHIRCSSPSSSQVIFVAIWQLQSVPVCVPRRSFHSLAPPLSVNRLPQWMS